MHDQVVLSISRHRLNLACRRLVETNLPYRNLEDAAMPIWVVATNVLSGGSVVLSKGNAADAIVARTVIPAAFASVLIGTQYLMDGAIT